MIPEHDLQAMQARCDAATPGPWTCVDNRNNHWGMVEVDGPAVHIQGFTVASDVSFEDGLKKRADRDFIAHARHDLPALLAAYRELQAEVVRLQERLFRRSNEPPGHYE